MMQNPPSISIALCTYNGERYLDDLLASLAGQERLPDEMVVCDDGSTDQTMQILRRFEHSTSFPVRIHVNERNLGATVNFERAMGLCSSDLIALCDQDDRWFPNKLARCVQAFEDEPNLGYVFSDAELIDGSGARTSGRLWHAQGLHGKRREVADRGDLLSLLVMHTLVTGATMVIRSDLRALAFPIPQGWVHDAWLAIIGSFVRPYRMIEEPLLEYRVHRAQEIGVPDIPAPDEAWGSFWTRWRLRLRQIPDVGGTDLNRRKRREQAELFRGLAERFEEAAGRYIEAFGGQPDPFTGAILAELRGRAAHLSVRGRLPDRRSQRVRVVAREFTTGRYRRYSAGALSALQDLVY